MSCCSRDQVQKCNNNIRWVVTLLFVLTLVTAFVHFLFADLDLLQFIPVVNSKNKEKDQQTFMASDIALLLGIFLTFGSLFLAAWTCCLNGIKSKCCLFPFSIFSFGWFCLSLSVAGFLFYQNVMLRAHISKRCKSIENFSQNQQEFHWLERPLWEAVSDFDQSISEVTNKYMCSSICPCFTNKKAYDLYSGYDETTLRKFGRSKSNEQTGTWQTLVWSTETYSFDNMLECY